MPNAERRTRIPIGGMPNVGCDAADERRAYAGRRTRRYRYGPRAPASSERRYGCGPVAREPVARAVRPSARCSILTRNDDAPGTVADQRDDVAASGADGAGGAAPARDGAALCGRLLPRGPAAGPPACRPIVRSSSPARRGGSRPSCRLHPAWWSPSSPAVRGCRARRSSGWAWSTRCWAASASPAPSTCSRRRGTCSDVAVARPLMGLGVDAGVHDHRAEQPVVGAGGVARIGVRRAHRLRHRHRDRLPAGHCPARVLPARRAAVPDRRRDRRRRHARWSTASASTSSAHSSSGATSSRSVSARAGWEKSGGPGIGCSRGRRRSS